MSLAKRKTVKTAYGFSIIEIIIATLLLAMLGLALSQSLTNAISAQKTIEGISTRYHLARQAMERIASEISMAYLSGNVNLTTPVIATNFKGEAEKIAFNAFGNVVFSKNSKESDQREISFYLGKDERTNAPALLRKIHANNTLKTGEEGSVATLCTFVKSLQFKYWDSVNENWSSTWKTEGGPDARKELPSRVKIELVIQIEDERDQKFLTETEIWLTKPIKILK